MKKILIILVICGVLLFLITAKTIKNSNVTKKNIVDFKHVCNYKDKLKYRYINYYKKNKNLSKNDVVTYVNIGLDRDFYTFTSETPFLNKLYILVNKYLYLDKNYVPNNLEILNETYSKKGIKLVKSAKAMFEKMYNDAKKEGYVIRIMSSYRSYEYQTYLYNKYKDQYGKKEADKYSARPGFSEHQTGLCIDIDDGKTNYENFDKSPSFTWMTNNSYKYGFILRYPKDKEKITGYMYEPWHYRYVGIDIAKFIHDNNITFDEYYYKYIKEKKKY
jgi:D-alanyl-D-alanine carboxypeptidase